MRPGGLIAAGQIRESTRFDASISLIPPAVIFNITFASFKKWPLSRTLFPMTTPSFQAPKGTRDFYPQEMAVRRHIEDAWRRVSIRHGFLEVDGPTFESLDLYKVKSGDEIVSQLFSFTDRGERDLALRPEFTPTLARMIAQRAAGLPRPIKWFSIPRCYRAEQPQKGRLREFVQWNVDFVGEASDRADGECLGLCADALFELGLSAADFRIGWNHRELLTRALQATFVAAPRIPDAYYILDRLQKLDTHGRQAMYEQRGCPAVEVENFELISEAIKQGHDSPALTRLMAAWPADITAAISQFQARLDAMGLGDFCRFDISIVRGLAYYTGFVFEASDARGDNRALAGGGRYDRLIETFGGPAMPAVGFGMGDVVLEILLRDRGLIPANPLPKADVFVINTLETPQAADQLIAQLRKSHWNADHTAIVHFGLGVQTSYRSTRNIGKLLQDAAASGAGVAVILAPQEFGRNAVKLKDMVTRGEAEVPLDQVTAEIRRMIQSARAADATAVGISG